MEFEVFIPSREVDGFDVTLRIGAENWMQALKLGLQRTGEEKGQVRNVLCDIKQSDLIHVTDLLTNRVFKIRQIPVGQTTVEALPGEDHGTLFPQGRFRHPKEHPAVSPPISAAEERQPSLTVQGSTLPPTISTEIRIEPEVSPVQPVLRTKPAQRKTGEPLGVVSASGIYRQIGACEISSGTVGEEAGAPRILQESVVPTRSRLPALSYLEDLQAGEAGVAESGIEEVFLEISEMFDGERSLEEATAFALDLAMGHISAESGSVLYADPTGQSLYFAAVRGPKSREILEQDFTVPMGRGIVGFCTREGVSVAVSDVWQDPRFYKEIAQAIGHDAKTILCAPIQFEGRCYGAIELLNHRRRQNFNPREMNILAYIASQAGRFISSLVL